MGTEDVKVTAAMNMYIKYKERLHLYKRWPCSTYILTEEKQPRAEHEYFMTHFAIPTPLLKRLIVIRIYKLMGGNLDTILDLI